MKRLLLCSSALLLSACSTNSQLSVVDNLTLVSKNDGVAFNPSRWFIDHPLQTTYVSLNGQLALKAGQVCTASSYRSPFTNICRSSDIGKLYREYYSPYMENSETQNTLKNFLDAVYYEREAQVGYVSATTDYYKCVAQKNAEIAKQDNLASDKVIEKTQQELSAICTDQKTALEEKLNALKNARLERHKQSVFPNRIIYNWAEALKFNSGLVVKERSNSGAGSTNREASGYTVVNGLRIKRFQPSCKDIQTLISQKRDSDRLKIVTLTLSADELYYDAREDKDAAFNANLSFSPSELKTLNNIFESDVKATINTELSAASSIASSGYLTAPKNPLKDTSTGLTFYAVLTDLKSFKCSGD